MSGISRLTALTIAGNYPDDILVDSMKHESGKHSGWIYLMRDGHIHTAQLSTQDIFDTPKEATDYMNEIVDACVNFVNEDRESKKVK